MSLRVPAVLILFSVFGLDRANCQDLSFPLEAKRILFLGDSNTHAGTYIELIDAQLRLAGLEETPELINLGLPSETCNGLSEPAHPFPRPNVHERIDRALEKIRPDVVVACYGMNDGIYYPQSGDRFAAYRDGIDGIIEKVHASGAELVLMTPPAFDPVPMQKKGNLLPLGAAEYSWKAIYEDYDDVMRDYSNWINDQNERVEMIVDLHKAVTEYLAKKRTSDPDFVMSPDGVHVDAEGHAVVAAAILKAWGLKDQKPVAKAFQELVSARQKLLHDAWLSEVGHLRPGVKEGLPIREAASKALEIDQQISEVDPQ